jgi:cysteinyl-tRNA synthetase
MSLQIYNSLSRQKEAFEPLQPGEVSLYVCGPTVYDDAHVGHAMSVVVFDIIRRYLEYSGYQVKYVMNYTDVDDKIIERANQENIPALELAQRYIQEFDQHLMDLNILPATVYPRASHTMESIIKMVQDLVDSGYAYEIDGDVYFRVNKYKDYGKLSGRRLEDMQAGTRIDIDRRKEHPEDFALWKAAKPDEPAWDTPWGKGRPGWHIECSAMNLAYLGEQIDIHGGGNDLVFPHHENEIAQTESLTDKPFARYWIHNGMLQFSGEKMSKSIGNMVTIKEFLAKHDADVFRMMILNVNYRSPLTFNEDVIIQAERAVERLHSALRPAEPKAGSSSGEIIQILGKQMEVTRQDFVQAMDDDFNTASALAKIFELVRVINQARDSGVDVVALDEAQTLLRELTGVLGLRLDRSSKQSESATPFIDLLLEIRSELRHQKLWTLSDKIRDRLTELGIVLEDTKDGVNWRWK